MAAYNNSYVVQSNFRTEKASNVLTRSLYPEYKKTEAEAHSLM